MKFGLFVGSQFHETDDPRQRFLEIREQVRLAGQVGFDSIWAGEHHVPSPFQYFSQFPLLARLAADAGDMQVGTNLVLLPLHNPVDIAEQGAMIDIMTDGRFVLGVGLGFRKDEFDVFGIPMKQRVGRLTEAMQIIDQLWSQDRVTFHGKYFRLNDIGIRPRPIQRPRPPIWLGATVDRAVERAAEIGDTWLMTSLPSMHDLGRQTDLYRQALRREGRAFPTEFPRMMEVLVAPTRDEAFERAAGPLSSKYAAYADWGQRELMSGSSNLDQEFRSLAKDRFVIGDVDDAVEGLKRQHDELGLTHLCMRMQWPGMAVEHAMESIELLGHEVIPRVRAGLATDKD